MAENTVVLRLADASRRWRQLNYLPQAIVAEAALNEIRRLEARIADLQSLHPTVEMEAFSSTPPPLSVVGADGHHYQISAFSSFAENASFDDSRYSASYLKSCDRLGEQFLSWLSASEVSLVELISAAERRDGQPLVDPSLVSRWLQHRASTGSPSATLKRNISSLAVWFARQGWNVSLLDSSSPTGQSLRGSVDGFLKSEDG